jgi:hypothetical protein
VGVVRGLTVLLLAEALLPAASPQGTLRFTAPAPFAEPVRIFLLAAGRPGDQAVEERSWEPQKGRATTSFELQVPRGLYVVAVDSGPGRAPAVFRKAELEGGRARALVLEDAPGRHVSVLVRDRAIKAPLPDAEIDLGGASSDEERVLLSLLHRRAPRTAKDGLLNLGTVSREELFVTVKAKGRRRAVSKVPVEFEGGVREVSLPPYQTLDVSVTGLLPRKDEAPPVLALGACGAGKSSPCDTGLWKGGEFRHVSIGEDGRGTFAAVAPGTYRLFLEWNGARAASRFVEASERAEDPDVARFELSLRERTFRGRVRFKDGRGAEATVSAGTASTGKSRGDSDDLGSTRSSPDGTFELRVFALPEHVVTLRASSEDPRGWGTWMKRGPGMFFPLDLEEGIEITLATGALKVTLKDRQTRKPIPDCVVAASLTARDGSGSSHRRLHSDPDGVVDFTGLNAGWARIVPHCAGYATKEGFEYDLKVEEGREEEALLDPTGDLVVRVTDRSGTPIAGARVSGFDVANAGSANGQGLHVNREIPIGESDAAGEVLAKGDRWSGVPFYVVSPAPACGVFIGRFPQPSACDDPSTCAVNALLAPPAAFRGLVVRLASGEAVSSSYLTFSAGDVPIPPSVLDDALLRCGLDSTRREGEDIVLLAPAVLPEGVYTVWRLVWDPKKPAPGRFVIVGSFRVPADRRIELTAPEP